MNLISKILNPQCIRIDLPIASKAALFEAVGAMFEQYCGLPAKKVIDALNEREKLGSTGLGMGIAIPHQRIKGLKEAQGAFIRAAAPIDFEAPDSQPVNLFFVMLAPEQANETHLRLLAELAQMFSDKTFRDHLLSAPDVAAIESAFNEWDIHAPGERSPTL